MTSKKKKTARKAANISAGKKGPELAPDGTWAPSVCNHLRKLRTGYERNTKRLVTLVNERKAIEKGIEEAAQDQKSRRADELKAQHFDIAQELAQARAQVRWYGDKMVQAIGDADQGELFENAPTKPTEQDLLFKSPPKNAWKAELIESASGLEDRVLSALKAVEITTWGDLAKHEEPLERIQGLTISDVAALQSGLAKAQGGLDPMGEDGEGDDE